MADEILFLESPLKEKIYGGRRIQDMFGFEKEKNKRIGEYWAISAHENGMSIITNGTYAKHTLKEVYEQHRELFNNAEDKHFPLLVKINEITRPVSVQVHPNDTYAKEHEHDSGKAEFCLYLDVDADSLLIRGHKASSREEFEELAQKQKWNQLLRKTSVKAGDYVYTPAGIVHGVEGRMLLAEVQQSSDVTYRIYDYDNTDLNGNPRELHMKKALDVICFPHKEPTMNIVQEQHGNNKILQYVDNEFFRITRYHIQEIECIKNERYSLCLVLKGEGDVYVNGEHYSLKAGQGFIVTSKNTEFQITGNIDILISEPGQSYKDKEVEHV